MGEPTPTGPCFDRAAVVLSVALLSRAVADSSPVCRPDGGSPRERPDAQGGETDGDGVAGAGDGDVDRDALAAWFDLPRRSRDCLLALAASEDAAEPVIGRTIRCRLETWYGDRVSDATLYDHLDRLVEAGLVGKNEDREEIASDRANTYALAASGRAVLAAQRALIVSIDAGATGADVDQDRCDTRERVD